MYSASLRVSGSANASTPIAARGTLFSAPMIAYVDADVAFMHQREQMLSAKPMTPERGSASTKPGEDHWGMRRTPGKSPEASAAAAVSGSASTLL
jgi:hypothetical protein